MSPAQMKLNNDFPPSQRDEHLDLFHFARCVVELVSLLNPPQKEPCAMNYCRLGLALLCLINFRAESANPECAAAGVANEFAVESSSDAAALQTLLDTCVGGVFDVTWQGRVPLEGYFTVENGTILNITGVAAGSSSSAGLSSDGGGDADVPAPTAVIEGTFSNSSFYVFSEGTLTLNNLVLENDPEQRSLAYGGAIYASTTYLGDNSSVVNIIDCTFQNNTALLGELVGVLLPPRR